MGRLTIVRVASTTQPLRGDLRLPVACLLAPSLFEILKGKHLTLPWRSRPYLRASPLTVEEHSCDLFIILLLKLLPTSHRLVQPTRPLLPTFPTILLTPPPFQRHLSQQ
jgi:hypothetical protein